MSEARKLTVFASASLESFFEGENTPDFSGVEQRHFSGGEISLESQQLEEVERHEALKEEIENFDAFLRAERPTGTHHLFLLDPELLATGDVRAQNTVRALAITAMTRKDDVTVAILPPPVDGRGEAAQGVVEQVVEQYSDVNVVSTESRAALYDLITKLSA